jgi:transposase
VQTTTGQTIPYTLPGFQIEEVVEKDNKLILKASSMATSGSCPDCGVRSDRVHSYYTRSPRDLPCGSQAVSLMLRVRRFRCVNATCPRATFVERLPHLVPVHGQRTTRLTRALRAVAFALGGEAGTRLLSHLYLSYSADTLLNIIRRTPVDTASEVRVLGVDDWAFRKGQDYGTILVDLERHQVVDLLPDREATTLASWLQAHPEIEVISRDRAGGYAQGATQGAPQAVQVADRWHLLKNLWEALAASYDCHYQLLGQLSIEQPATRITQATPNEVSEHDVTLPTTTAKPVRRKPLSPTQQARADRRQYWLDKFDQVHALRTQGMSLKAIARELDLNIRTVRKYSQLTELPKKTSPKPGPRILDPYRAYLRERLSAGDVPSRQLWQEIRRRGFTGGHSTVYKYVAQLRRELGISPRKPAAPTAEPRSRRLTSRTLATLGLRPPDTRSDTQQQLIDTACQLHPEIQIATQLASAFATMLRERDVDRLDMWLHETANCQIPSLVGFVSGIMRDYAAVKTSFSLPWSNGQVEGQVNRLKFIKRQMYGRAKFDLLRARVLHPP